MSARIRISGLDLDITLGCGQTFRWRRLGPGAWRGPIGDCVVDLRNNGRWLFAESKPVREDLRARVSGYLRLGDDIDQIRAELSRDPVIGDGPAALRGLRLVKMDEWECLASYTLATFANIPRITKMIETLSGKFGDSIDGEWHAFPSVSRLRKARVGQLRACGLGYRAEYLAALSRAVDEKRIDAMSRMPDDELRVTLLGLPGVGNKVADCVMLFGFGRLGAFPIDVWVMRALSRLYGVDGTYRELRDFATSRFGRNAGYAQEYLFYNERVLSTAGACVFTRPGGSSCRTP
jgi:N-glycosylase/DNA lyase